jgi:hypothetical protein
VTKPRKQPRSDTPPLGSSEPCFIFQEAPQLKFQRHRARKGFRFPFTVKYRGKLECTATTVAGRLIAFEDSPINVAA